MYDVYLYVSMMFDGFLQRYESQRSNNFIDDADNQTGN